MFREDSLQTLPSASCREAPWSKTWSASKMNKRITLKLKVVQRIWICQLCFASFSRFSTKSQRGLISEELSKALRQLLFCSSTYFWYTVLWILMVVLLSWLRIVRCSNWLPTKPELRVCDLLPLFFWSLFLDLFGDAALPAHSFVFLHHCSGLSCLTSARVTLPNFAEPWLRQRSWCRKQLQLEWVHWQSRSFPVSHPVVPHGAGQWMCLQMLASLVSRVLPLVPLLVQLRPTSLALWCQIQGWAAMWAPSICNAQMLMEDHRTLFPWRAHASTVKLLLQKTTKLPTLSHGLKFPLARPPVHPQVAPWWDVLWQRLWQGWQCKKLESGLLLACFVFRNALRVIAQCKAIGAWCIFGIL